MTALVDELVVIRNQRNQILYDEATQRARKLLFDTVGKDVSWTLHVEAVGERSVKFREEADVIKDLQRAMSGQSSVSVKLGDKVEIPHERLRMLRAGSPVQVSATISSVNLGNFPASTVFHLTKVQSQ